MIASEKMISVSHAMGFHRQRNLSDCGVCYRAGVRAQRIISIMLLSPSVNTVGRNVSTKR